MLSTAPSVSPKARPQIPAIILLALNTDFAILNVPARLLFDVSVTWNGESILAMNAQMLPARHIAAFLKF